MVAIEFDKPRNLKFDMSAVRDLEAQMDGKPLGAIINDIQRLGITALIVSLWAGLKHEDKTLNINLVSKMLDAHLKAGLTETGPNARLRVISDAISSGLIETGLFGGDNDEGNAQPEPAIS